MEKLLVYNKNGITLIALVITIIVLLILAGVSISMLTGDNGILTQAQNAKNKTEEAARKEEQDLAEIESIMTGKRVVTQVDDKNPGELEKEDKDTFIINSIEDLVFFSYDVTNGTTYEGKTVKLGTNLDFKSDKSYINPNRTDFAKYGYNGKLKELLTSGSGFSPIGNTDEITGEEKENCFYGTFEGNNKVICSLYINTSDNVTVGLFSYTCGIIQNLGLEDVFIKTSGKIKNVGGIAGWSSSNLYNCYVTGNIEATGNSWLTVGGVCGIMRESSSIENSYNLSNIICNNTNTENNYEADISCGGIVGQGDFYINKCFNEGNIYVDGGNNCISVGGIIGHIDYRRIIKNCYNVGKIEGIKQQNYEGYVSGIVGIGYSENIQYCYNSGEIIGSGEYISIGGIIARKYGEGEITNVFNIGDIVVNNQENQNLRAIGGIIGQVEGTTDHINLNNAYNIGNIELGKHDSQYVVGSIAGTNWMDLMSYNSCYYLAETYEKGVGYGTSVGIQDLPNISDFPSILEIVNKENAFKEDVNNENRGYPVLDM